MDSSEGSLMEMENQSSKDAVNSEEIPDQFVCCVCLDLLYKPIVLHCGHMACFWCVHKSMNTRNESHCPICRNPYSHFPGICQVLHFLLLKLYPTTYKKREHQILEEEKRTGYFSPELNSHECELHGDGEFDYCGSPTNSTAMCFRPSTYPDSTRNDKLCNTTEQNCDEDLNQIKPVSGLEKEQISVADLLCTACKQLLFRPVVLNCGHVYCQTCIIPTDKVLRCQVCQSLHPRDFPTVCLTLDQFLADRFSKEYSLRRNAIQLKQASSDHERATTYHLPLAVEPGAYTHRGVGCDACGMSPIVGDRYKCKDCTEAIGFDLCRDCYNTRLKLPGRFNQRHTPEHKFELIKRDMTPRLLTRITEQLENVSTSVVISDFVAVSRDNTIGDPASPYLHMENQDDAPTNE